MRLEQRKILADMVRGSEGSEGSCQRQTLQIQ